MGLVSHLEKLLDHFSEEVRQGGGLCNGGIGSNGCSILVALLAVCADEGVEQQRQPVPGKLPQHLHITAGITSTLEPLSQSHYHSNIYNIIYNTKLRSTCTSLQASPLHLGQNHNNNNDSVGVDDRKCDNHRS